MRSPNRLKVLGAAALAFGLFGAACLSSDDDDDSNRPNPGDGSISTSLFDAGADDDALSGPGCPDGIPKIGEACTPPSGDSNACNYTVDSCVRNGNTYDVQQEWDCVNGIWYSKDVSDSPCLSDPGDSDAG